MSVSFEIDPNRGSGREIPERDARHVQTARRTAAAWLRLCGLDPLVEDVTLIVSELVTNAIVHSGGAGVTLSLKLTNDALRIDVCDGVPVGPVVQRPCEDAESGRGLILVKVLSDNHGGEWGTSDSGTTTWCCLPLPAAELP